jgi:hypothetical protein
MEVFLEEEDGPKKFPEFRAVMERINAHPSRKYFVFKTIIVNNLYGVDIMEEAVEICKLRMFLKLAAQVDRFEDIEPLPDIDFNVRAGNTLVGFANIADVKRTVAGKLADEDQGNEIAEIEEEARTCAMAFAKFRECQTDLSPTSGTAAKVKGELQKYLDQLNDKLNKYLAAEYSVRQTEVSEYENWLNTHQPFHWFSEFYGIMSRGGFNVIVGNPPYIEYSKVKKSYTLTMGDIEATGNLYAFCIYRCLSLLSANSGFGLIVPISLVCTQRMEAIQNAAFKTLTSIWLSNYGERPSKLFSGAEVLLTIALGSRRVASSSLAFTTGFIKWAAAERETLFSLLSYAPIERKPRSYIWPKLGCARDAELLATLFGKPNRLGDAFLRQSKFQIYYRIGGGRYWKVFSNFQPQFVLNGSPGVSSRENYLYFSSAEQRDAAIAVLSSSLFYWYFVVTTNGRDLNPSDLAGFPVNLSKFDSVVLRKLALLSSRLMEDYKQKSQIKVKESRQTGTVQYQEFYPRQSKALLDEIDAVIAEHLGFTKELLDHVINFDFRFRMGADESGDDE